MVEKSSLESSVEHTQTESTLNFCDAAEGENQKVKGSFQGGASELLSLPKLDLVDESKGSASFNKFDSKSAESPSSCQKPVDEPDPGSAGAVAETAEESKHAQYWKRDRSARARTQNGLFGCALQASEVMVKAGAISKTVFGVGQLIEQAKDAGWTEVKDSEPIKPGDLVISYHPANPKAEGQRHASIAAEPNEKGEPMVWNNTNRTRGQEDDDRSKRWDKEPLSNLPYPAYKVYRAPESD